MHVTGLRPDEVKEFATSWRQNIPSDLSGPMMMQPKLRCISVHTDCSKTLSKIKNWSVFYEQEKINALHDTRKA